MNTQQSKPFINWLLFIFLAIIWGSAFILIKKGLVFYSPLQVATLRIFTAFVILLPVLIYITLKNTYSLKQWMGFTFVGFIGSLIPAFLFSLGQTQITSSTAGILGALTPVFTLLISVFIFHQKFNKQSIIGLVLGFIGTSTLILFAKNGAIDLSNFYGLLIVLATLSYGININFIKFNLQGIDSFHTACLSLAVTGPLAGIYLFTTDFLEISLKQEALSSFWAVIILGFTATGLGLIFFHQLIKRSSALFASSITYLMPVIAIFWGLLDNESLNSYHFIGMISIIMGIFLINKK